MMPDLTPLQIFDRAQSTTHGVELALADPKAARSVRRRLYAEREKLRAQGNHAYDNLSFIIKWHELWIVPRDRLHKTQCVSLLDCRPLQSNELPDRILSRGKSRVGI